MFQKLKHYGRFEITFLLAAMSVFCFTILGFRLYQSGTKMYLFLCWNLFLAFIPWVLSSVVIMSPWLRGRKAMLWFLLPVWLLFFPNSPYILTDLFHLRLRDSMPVWFDLGLILSFAWTGLVYGFISLYDIEHLLAKRVRRSWVSLIIVALLFISGFGIYLGRYLRWNSWDILHRPAELLGDVIVRFTDPLAHPRTWGMTILMGIVLNAMFWSIRLLRKTVPVS